jgi:hypothetical protein
LQSLRVSDIRDSVDDLTKSCVVERLVDAARINSADGVARSTLLVVLDSALHSRTTIKHDVKERGIGQDIGDGSKGGELAQRVASKGGVRLDKAFRA